MRSLSESMPLTPHEWEALRELADRLERAWLGGDGLDLKVLIGDLGPPLRAPYLMELVKTDLEMRYRRNRPKPLEWYLERFPELGSTSTVSVDLILEEYRVRHRFGDQPPLASYQARFPNQFDELQQLAMKPPPGTLLPDAHTPTMRSLPAVGGRSASASPPNWPPAPVPPPQGSEDLTGGGSYTLLMPSIGRGEFGEVFRAMAPGGVAVAVKRVFRPTSHAASQREREALELIKSLRHPYLLQTQAYWTEKDRLYIVMELADGSLSDRFKECVELGGPGIPMVELLDFMAEAAEALDFLHSRRVVHRDVKPANLLRLQGHAKVADFGVARLFSGDDLATVCGTPAYMAPEVWNNRGGIHSDQFSLASTLIEMACGRRPTTPGKSAEEVAKDLACFTEAQRRVFRKALDPDPAKRYPSCVEFISAVREATFPRPVIKTGGGGGARHLPIALAVILLAVLAAWVVTYFARLMVGDGTSGKKTETEVVEPSPSWLPAGFEPKVRGKDPRLPDALTFELHRGEDGAPVEFLLITGKAGDPERRNFYIMKDKVTNEQFLAALDDPGMQRALKEWRDRSPEGVREDWGPFRKGIGKDDLKRPVMGVTAVEAHCFAQRLGGEKQLVSLPSVFQWDKAGGRYDGAEGWGPFKQGWAGPPARLKPSPVGQDEEDISRFGVRGMSANGAEWTRTAFDGAKSFPQVARDGEKNQTLHLRGGSFMSQGPFLFKDDPATREYWKWGKHIGFRVVLEPPDPGKS